jgi:hypothetical protein
MFRAMPGKPGYQCEAQDSNGGIFKVIAHSPRRYSPR